MRRKSGLYVPAHCRVQGGYPRQSPRVLSGRSGLSLAAGDALTLLQEGFDDNEAGLAARGWYDGNAATISTSETHGGAGSLQATLNSGADQTSWGVKRHLFAPTDTLYVSYWVKYSTNWIGSGEAFHPHEWEFLSDIDDIWGGLSISYLGAYVEHNYQSGGIPRLALQDSAAINYTHGSLPRDLISVTEDRSHCGCNGVMEAASSTSCFDLGGGIYFNAKEFDGPGVAFQPNPGAGYKNDWNHVEVYFAMNSIINGIGQANGIMQYWFNNALLINRGNIVYRTGQRPTLKWQQIICTPYMGSLSPVTQTAWYDDLLVATGRPTPPETPPGVKLAFTQEPSSVLINTSISPPVLVGIQDDLGNIVTTATPDVTMAKATGPGALSGTLVKGAVGGIATFNDLALDAIGTYSLLATSPALTPDTSIPFAASSGGGGGDFPNEPGGAVVLFDEHADLGNAAWRSSLFGFISGTGNLATVTDVTAPMNTTIVGSVTFNPGCCDGSGPAQLENFDRPPSGWDDWYIADWFRFSPTFIPNVADQKIWQIHFSTAGGDNFIRFCVPGLGGSVTFTPRYGAVAAQGGGIQNIGGVQMVSRGVWYLSETIWTRATGRLRGWITPQGGAAVQIADETIANYQVPPGGASEVLFWWWGYGGSGAYPSGSGQGFIYHNHWRSSYVP